MDKYLIDTTVLIDYLRGNGRANKFLNGLDEVNCSLITAAELYQGARNKIEQRLIDRILTQTKIISLTPEIGNQALQLTKNYSISFGIQISDALIAATAIKNSFILVSSNVKHFNRISNLRLYNWGKIPEKV